MTSDVKVRLDEAGDCCFPDLTVVCGEIDDELDVVEVLSPGTQDYDKGPKFERYLLVPSIEEIVFISQDRPRVERYRRHGGVRAYEAVDGVDARIEVLGQPLRLADVYRKVRFSPGDPPRRD